MDPTTSKSTARAAVHIRTATRCRPCGRRGRMARPASRTHQMEPQPNLGASQAESTSDLGPEVGAPGFGPGEPDTDWAADSSATPVRTGPDSGRPIHAGAPCASMKRARPAAKHSPLGASAGSSPTALARIANATGPCRAPVTSSGRGCGLTAVRQAPPQPSPLGRSFNAPSGVPPDAR